MNDFMIFLYLTFFVAILGATFAFMFKTMTATFDEMDKPTKTKRSDLHPEMRDVESGEQLLVFNPRRDEDDDGEGDVFISRR
tara:strand:- start:4309 stop:4554 length:246 start_codon:yes stop_codon:yes gene_type:complete